MLFISVFDAKPDTLFSEINRERVEWFEKGIDRIFEKRCKSVDRYEIVGSSPLKIIFMIETEDPGALNLLSHHFGDAWNSVTYPAIRRELREALQDDTAVVAG